MANGIPIAGVNSSGDKEDVDVVDGGLKTYNTAVQSGEDVTNDVQVVEQGRFRLIANTIVGSNPLGTAGAVGDYLQQIVFPRGMVAGAGGLVIVKDGGTAKITIQTALLATDMLAGTVIPINAISVSGAWSITIQANSTAEVSAVGRFTDS